MKPNGMTGMSSAGRNDRDASSLSAQLTEVPGDLEPTASLQELGTQYVEPPRRPRYVWRRTLSVSILVVGMLAGVLLSLHQVQVNKKQAELNSSQAGGSALIKPQTISLNDLGLQPFATLTQTNVLTVNGDVNVSGSVLLNPTTTPSGAVAGQLYFDSLKNQVGYYNGSRFVYLQGGSAASTNNVTNVTNTTNVTNVTNNYGTTGITAINGTAGSLAMFDGAGGLTESLISQAGSSLNTGTGVEDVTIGSTNGSSTTVVQGGTGNVAINTGGTTGSSGSITIKTGDSATTAAGNVTIDTGSSIISGTQVADKTFEDGIDNMADATYGDNSTVAQTTAEARNGTHSLSVAVGSTFFPSWSVGDGASNPPLNIPVSAGHTYAFSAWVRAGTNSDAITGSVIWSNDGYGGGGEISQQTFGSATDITTGWRQIAGVLTAPVGAAMVGFYFSSSNAQTVGEVHYFDDITVTDLSTSASDASINIGDTNAQVITIGNSGMLAPTTIYGGGINLYAGTGFVNVSGSNIAATSGGASYQTTSGALDITAATSSTWKVGQSAGTGGDLTIQAGNGGVNSSGGNLILEGGASNGTGTGGGVVVKPQTDSANAFQVQNSSGSTTMLNVGTAGAQAINDNFISNAPTGTFVRGASWVSGQYVELDNGGPGVDGEVNYQLSNVGYSFNSTFDFWSKAGGGDGTFLYAYDQRPPASFHLGSYYGGGGYIFAYADTAMGSYVGIYYDGTQLASAPISATDTSTWHTAQVTKVGNMFTMYLDGTSVLTYTDAVTRDLSGTNFGVGGCSCSYSGEHRATNLVMSGDPFLTTGGSTQLGGNVAVVGSLSAPTINTNQISMASSLTVKPWSDSTSAFTIQSAYDATLFSVDTTNAVITVSAKLQVNGNLILDGHLQTSGTTPAIAAGAAACTSPTVSIAGNDTAGTITVNTGTGCTGGGTLATVTFASAYGSAPIVELTPGSPISQTLGAYVDDSTVSATAFDLGTNATPMSSQTFKWNYLVVQ